jgi:hypothetical protein
MRRWHRISTTSSSQKTHSANACQFSTRLYPERSLKSGKKKPLASESEKPPPAQNPITEANLSAFLLPLQTTGRTFDRAKQAGAASGSKTRTATPCLKGRLAATGHLGNVLQHQANRPPPRTCPRHLLRRLITPSSPSLGLHSSRPDEHRSRRLTGNKTRSPGRIDFPENHPWFTSSPKR